MSHFEADMHPIWTPGVCAYVRSFVRLCLRRSLTLHETKMLIRLTRTSPHKCVKHHSSGSC